MAKKDIPAIVSAMGLVSAFTVDLTKAVFIRSGTEYDIYRALSDPDVIKDIAEMLVDYDTQNVRIAVDGEVSQPPDFDQLVRLGQYADVDRDVTAEHFPLPRRMDIRQDLYLVRLRTHLDGEEALKRLDQRGYNPAGIGELLELGASDPVVGMGDGVVALATRWNRDGFERVPFIHSFGGTRRLACHMSLKGSFWTPHTRFLAVKK